MSHRGKRYRARAMLEVSTAELHDLLQGEFTLVMDDGDLEVTARSTILSSYIWDFHRLYPDTPLLKEHHFASIISSKPYANSTHIKILERVLFCVYETYKDKSHGPDTNILAKRAYEITNNIYNDMVIRAEEYVVSLDITDFIEIMNAPKVKEVLDNVSESPTYVENCYKVLKEALHMTPSLYHNNLALATRSGLVREGQTLQCVGPRGFVTDVDSHYFKFPITRGFAKGLRNLESNLIESRSSAKSLASNKILLSGAEYFSRRLQVLDQIVETVHEGDCGSTNYLRWKVRAKELDEHGRQLRPSDLDILQGKYYLDEKSGKLSILKSNQTDLIGKTIKIRSPIAGCAHPDPNGICSVCFGDLSLSVPKQTNIGHLCSATMMQQSNQNILSTKHYLDGASLGGDIRIPPEYADYLIVSKSGHGYMFNPALKDKENYIVLTPQSVTGLVDLPGVTKVEDLSLTHVSDITAIGLRSIDKTGIEDQKLLQVAVDRRKASFTYPFLDHIKKVGWSFDEKGNYVISLQGWNYNSSALRLPMRQYNMSDHADSISIAIESNQERLKEKEESQSAEDELIELSDLVNSRLNVNIALLEVILLGSLVRSIEKNDYYIPKAGTEKQMSVAALTISNRSLSGMIAYDAMAQKLVNPSSMFHDNRPQLMMDVFIKPQETIEDPYRYEKYYRDY